MSDSDMTLGRCLEAARQEAGLTLRQLAEASDIQLTSLVRIVGDRMQSPKPEQLIRLANVLELRASDLFLLADLPIPQDLPSVEALLRAEYDLPEDAVHEVTQQIQAIVARYKATAHKRKEDKNGTNN